MSTDRDTTRIVRSWLRVDENESADRVLGTVLDRLDTTPQRRAISTRRLPDMSYIVRYAAVAAVVAMAAVIGYSVVAGPPEVGPLPIPSASAGPPSEVVPSPRSSSPRSTFTPVAMPELFRARDVRLVGGDAETILNIELPIDGSLSVDQNSDLEWRFGASEGSSTAYLGTWGLVVADVTDASNHVARFRHEAIPTDTAAAFLAGLGAIDGYDVFEQPQEVIGGMTAEVADVVRATLGEPSPSEGADGYPHLDVHESGGLSFDGATRIYVVQVGERLILVHFWSTTAEGLEAHQLIEDRIVDSIQVVSENGEP